MNVEILRQTSIVIIPLFVFLFGQYYINSLTQPDMEVLMSNSQCVEIVIEPLTEKYIMGATFMLALFIAIFVSFRSLVCLMQSSQPWIFILTYVLLSATLIYVNYKPFWGAETSLDGYIALIPAVSSVHPGSSLVDTMVEIVNGTFVLAAVGVLLSAAALVGRTKKTIKNSALRSGHLNNMMNAFDDLRAILLQASCVLVSGVTFMYSWIEYSIEIGAGENYESYADMALGVQIFQAFSFLMVMISLAVLAHYWVNKDFEESIRSYRGEDKEALRREVREKASYYREFTTSIGLFAAPVLGNVDFG